MARSSAWRPLLHRLALACLFVSQLFCAVLLHLDTHLARRLLGHWASDYVSREIRGTLRIGDVERLTTSSIWLRDVALFDQQMRPVVSFGRVRATSVGLGALVKWLTRQAALTIVLDTVRIDGVRLHLENDAASGQLSLASALQPDPDQQRKRAGSAVTPFRVFLPTVEVGEVVLKSALPNLISDRTRIRNLLGQLLVTDQGLAIVLKRFSLDSPDLLPLPLHAFGSFDYRSRDRAWGDVQVTLGQIPASLSFRYDRDELQLSTFMPKIDPLAARQLIAGWPLAQPLAMTFSANGRLDQLKLTLEATAGISRATGSGVLALVPRLHAQFAVAGHQLELGSLLGLPVTTQFDTTMSAELDAEGGQPQLRFEGSLDAGTVGRFSVPSVELRGEYNAEGLLVSGRSRDPNLPARAALASRGHEIDVEAQLDGMDLRQLLPSSMHQSVGGSASLRARATIANGNATVATSGSLHNLRFFKLGIEHANLTAEIKGLLAELSRWSGEAQVTAQHLSSPYLGLDRLNLNASGGAESIHLLSVGGQTDRIKLRFETDLLPKRGLAFERSRLDLTREADKLTLRVGTMTLGSSSAEISAVELDGTPGQARGSLSVNQGRLRVALESPSIDLDACSRLLWGKAETISGRTSVHLDLDNVNVPSKGTLRLGFENVGAASLPRFSGQLQADLVGEHLTTSVAASSDVVANIQGQIDLILPAQSSGIESIRLATGSAAVALNGVQLERVSEALGARQPRPKFTGTGKIELRAEKSRAESSPHLTVLAQTNGFGLTLPIQSRTIQLNGMELALVSSFGGDTSELRGDCQLTRDGQLAATLQVQSALPSVGDRFEDLANLPDALRQIPFNAVLMLPRQRIQQWLSTLALPPGSGDAELKLWVLGPWDQAHGVLQIRASDLAYEPLAVPLPFDLEGLVEYDRSRGEARLAATVGAGHAAWLQFNAMGNIESAAAEPHGFADWNGRLEVDALDLPIQALPKAAELGLTGSARGLLSVKRSQATTSVDGIIPVDQLRMHEQPLGQALVNIRSDRDNLIVGAKLLDGGAQIEVEANVPVLWSDALPRRRTGAPLRLAATASGYDASIASPWLDKTVAAIGGELNGRVEMTYDGSPNPSSTPPVSPSMTLGGSLTLTHGKATLRDLGLTLTDISIAAQASSTNGRTVVSVPASSAAIGEQQGRLSGSMFAEFDGVELRRLTARVDQAKDVPLSINSVNVASLSGVANVELSPRSPGIAVDVEFDALEVRLPRRGTRQVVGLTEHPDIVVVQPLGSDAWQKAHKSSTSEYYVRLNLGRKTRVIRNDFTLPISGIPELSVGKRIRPSGTVELEPLGRIELFGKSFVIDHGHLTLDPEQPSNPQLDIVANWRGPTHQVTVQIQGALNEARLRLTSDPPLGSEAQVMALLLGGANGDDSTASAGLGVGASLFNEVLSDTPISGLEVRTSSDDRHANYTAAVPIRENLWFEATYQSSNTSNVLGNSTPSGFSGTVDYRFRRNWSVRTEVGTLGAGADLMWQYRY